MILELKKCIGKKQVIFYMLFFVIWGLLVPGVLTYGYWRVNLNAGYETKSDVVKRMEQKLSDLSDKEILNLEMEEHEKLRQSKTPFILWNFLYESAAKKATLVNAAQSYYSYGTSTMHIRKMLEMGKPRSIRSVQSALSKNQNQKLAKQRDMLETVGKPQTQFTRFMEYYENFTNTSMVIIVTFLLLVFSNTGSQEWGCNMHLLLYSTPVSKMKIFVNKILAVIVTGSSIMLLLDLCHFVIFFGAGYGGNLTVPLNCLSLDFAYCPYAISVLEYFLFKFLVGQLTVVVLAAIIVFISMKWKSSIITIAVAGTVTLGGYAVGVIGFDRNVFVRYSLAGGIRPYFLFRDFFAAETGNIVVLYPVIYLMWLLGIFLFCIWGLLLLARNRKIMR